MALPLLFILTALLLSSCRSEVTTRVDVAGDATSGSLVLTMSDEAAEALRGDPASDQRLMSELARRSNSPVDREDLGDRIVYRTSLPTGAGHTLVTGVEVDAVTTAGESSSVTLTFVRPTVLAEAIAASVATESDAGARDLVIQRSTAICADVRFKGSVESVDGAEGLRTERGDRSVLMCSSLEDLDEPVTVTVSGSNNGTVPLAYVGGVLALLALLGFMYRRFTR
jgi:hypothetical protein